MKLWDYHTHCSRCNHALGSIEDYIREGIKKGMAEIGISDHFPMDLLPARFHIYAMPFEEFSLYIDEIKRLKEKYEHQIIVRVSSEVDFFPEAFRGYKQIIKPFMEDFDYIIGSIHAVPWKEIQAIPIDEAEAIPTIREIGVDRVYLQYYDTLLKMVKTNFYQIVGHFDVPKKYGLIPQNPEVIWQRIMHILDYIEGNGMAVEINTSGFYKVIHQPYPSEAIITELIHRKIPITLGSDAHRPEDVGFSFLKVIRKCKKLGLKYLCLFSKREKKLVPFD